MKKKLLLGILAATLAFVGLNGVKADGLAEYWPVWNNGDQFLLDNNQMVCYYESETCKRYHVTNDWGDLSDVITVADDQNNSITIGKYQFSPNYALIKTKKDVQCIQECGDGDLTEDEDFVELRHYKQYVSLSDIISDTSGFSDKYVNIFMPQITSGANIPANYTVASSFVDVNNIKVNGYLKTGTLWATSITGTGNIEVGYDILPPGAPFVDYDRIVTNSIEGVKLNITGTQIKEGLLVGKFGEIETTTKENAQKIINQINNVKGSTLNGYKVVLKETSLIEEEPSLAGVGVGENTKIYVGRLVKETASEKLANTVSNIKKAVKNPKTGDTLFKILGAITLAGAGFVVTVKKAKQK